MCAEFLLELRPTQSVASTVGEGGISIRFANDYLAHLLETTTPEAQSAAARTSR
jgi:hypothetical protein